MALAEPHANLNRHLESIRVAAEAERAAMEEAEAETRRAIPADAGLERAAMEEA